MSGGGWYLTFHKTPNFCQVCGCDEKYYAKNRCRKHYEQWHRDGAYCLTTEEYLNMKVAQRRKEDSLKETEKKLEILIKDRVTREFYQKLKEANLPKEFKYKDIMKVVDWKYQRIKKHILRLVKLRKIEALECHSGGGSKQGKFRLPVTLF